VIKTKPYPKLDADNCTNFVSQSLHHGGRKINDTTYPFRKKPKWTWD
jgi:hypothetical protein